jgi:PAS domain S-box-containing protein
VWERDAQSGDYTFITDRVVDILGYSINAWIGRSDFWTFILHPADREEAVAAAAAATAAGQDWEQTYRAVGADGRTVWLHDLVHVVRDDTGAAATVLGVSIDVTTQKRQDEAMALLAEFGSREDADQVLAERLDALVRAATPLLGELSAVVLVGPDNLLRPFVAAAPEHPDAVTTLLGFAPLPLPPSLADRLATGRAVVLPGAGGEILSEVVADEDELKARLAVGARDWLVVPLMAAGRLLGMLAFTCFTRPRAYDRLDMTLAEEFGHRIALVIRTDEAAGRERHLRDVSAALASADTPAAVGRVLRTGLAHAFGASGLTIQAVGPDTHLLRLVTAAGYPAEVTQRLRVVRLSDRSPIAECARTGEPVWPRDAGGGPARPDEQVDGGDAVVARAAVALPLRTGGRLVGVVADGLRPGGPPARTSATASPR